MATRSTAVLVWYSILSLAVFIFPALGAGAGASESPAAVLVIVNDATPPEPGTGALGASEYVGLYYAQARGIPLGNILHVNSPMSPDSQRTRVSWDDFNSQIRSPLKAFLEIQGLQRKIKYIVATYGVPSIIVSHNGFENLSVDSFIASTYSPASDEIGSSNPVFLADPKSMPAHWKPADLVWPMYAVTRLDGPSPALAVSLVERALQAERGITRGSGVGYFDFRALNGNDLQATADRSVARAATLCMDAGFTCELNDQSVTRTLISSARQTLWAWGGSGGSLRDAYSFAPGAVGAQLASGDAGTRRSIGSGSWASLWITQGITATWEATSDLHMSLYTAGDNLLNHLWNGYSFGEAAYMATPSVNGIMVFIGDPLYSPVFADDAPRAPSASSSREPLSTSRKVGVVGTAHSAGLQPRAYSVGKAVAAGNDTLSLSSASGTAGGTVALNLNLTSSGGAQTAGIQWTFSYSSDITGVTVVAGSPATTAQKSVTCNGNICVIYGMMNNVPNSNVIPDGTVAVATFKIASNPSTTTIPIQVTAMVTASTGGNSIQTSASGGTITTTTGTITKLTNVGMFRQGFFWLLDVDGNRQFNSPPDLAFAFGGIPEDIPITGDWNGNGHTKAGIYRPSNGLFILDSNGDGQLDAGDAVYNLGVGTQPGDIPVVGDWNGDGRTKVGLFRQGFFWILDYNGNGVFEAGIDKTYAFGGTAGDVPVVGDWTGTGTSKIGLVRQGFFWILDANGNGSFDGTGQGQDLAFAFGGMAGDVPVVGDWNGDGTSKVGVFRQGFFWVLDANGNHQFDGTGPGQDLAFAFGGIGGDKPVVGKW